LIERDLVASWLNVMAGNDKNEATPEGEDAEYWIDQAIAYLNAVSPGDKKAWSDGVLYDSNGDGVTDGDDEYTESGSDIHNALDGWNNSGELDGFAVAVDGDEAGSLQFQSFYEAVA
jgi:hypothetical protein